MVRRSVELGVRVMKPTNAQGAPGSQAGPPAVRVLERMIGWLQAASSTFSLRRMRASGLTLPLHATFLDRLNWQRRASAGLAPNSSAEDEVHLSLRFELVT
jgi:hypothetical protein